MSYLLDTNVISEPKKPKPNQKVLDWMSSVSPNRLYISVLTIGEIRKGIELNVSGKRKAVLTDWLENDVSAWFTGRVIVIDEKVAEKWGEISAENKNLPAIDGLIAASCLVYNLFLVTRNVKDFAGVHGLQLLNPWK